MSELARFMLITENNFWTERRPHFYLLFTRFFYLLVKIWKTFSERFQVRETVSFNVQKMFLWEFLFFVIYFRKIIFVRDMFEVGISMDTPI